MNLDAQKLPEDLMDWRAWLNNEERVEGMFAEAARLDEERRVLSAAIQKLRQRANARRARRGGAAPDPASIVDAALNNAPAPKPRPGSERVTLEEHRQRLDAHLDAAGLAVFQEGKGWIAQDHGIWVRGTARVGALRRWMEAARATPSPN